MDRYALFFDLDGTLMEDVGHLYPNIEKTLRDLKENGHMCFVATGRGYSNVPDSLKTIMDGFVTLTGAGCFYKNKILIQHNLPKEYIDQFARLSFSVGAPVYIENDERMDMIASGNFQYEKEVVAMRGYMNTLFETIEEYESNTNVYSKIDTRIKFNRYIDELPAVKTGKLDAVDAGDGWYEILIGGVNKGSTIRDLCSRIGQDMNKTICFGDSDNDLSMFETCGISVAVSNALESVKNKASIVLEGNNQDEVIRILHELHLVNSN